MRIVAIFIFFTLSLFADEALPQDTNTTQSSNSNEPVVVQDTSGLSNDEIRDVAKEVDKKIEKKEKLNNAIDALLQGTFDENAQKEKTWEELSPTPKNYDWIQTKSGEWFKGYIKAMFDKKLEFDSAEMGLENFKFKNIKQIKSYQIIGVNIDKIAIFEGVIRLKNDKIRIIQGNNEFVFNRDEIVSFAQSGVSEKNHWYAKVSISMDWRKGNSNQTSYSAQATLKRRTAGSRLIVEYLGKVSSVSGKDTVDNHRLNQKFDLYLNKNFYWTPLFSEIYQDKFRNIDIQLTAGTGVGYFLINNYSTELDLNIGPGMLFTNYRSVEVDQRKSVVSYSVEMSTRYVKELTKNIDFRYLYKFTFTDDKSGFYKHHMLAKLENELTSWLDVDFTAVWDYINLPAHRSNGKVPKKDDFQILIGLGMVY